MKLEERATELARRALIRPNNDSQGVASASVFQEGGNLRGDGGAVLGNQLLSYRDVDAVGEVPNREHVV